MKRRRLPPIDATRTHDIAAGLEELLGPGFDLVHTKRMGWILRQLESRPQPDGRSRSVYVEVDSAPDGQLGALLIRHQHRMRGTHEQLSD